MSRRTHIIGKYLHKHTNRATSRHLRRLVSRIRNMMYSRKR